MNIRIEKNKLLQGLYLAQGIVDRRATMPILGNVLIQTVPSGIFIAATDLAMTLTMNIPCEKEKEGSITVSARQLYEIIKTLPTGTLTITTGEEQSIDVSIGKIRYKVLGLPAKDFPKLPKIDEVRFAKVSAKILLDMIDKTIFSVSMDETRPHLSGIFLESLGGEKNAARMVSTDGHRLSKCEREVESDIKSKPGIIIPRRSVLEFRKFLDGIEKEVEVGIYQGFIFFKKEDTVISSKLNDSQFPPYEQVVPKEHTRLAVLEKSVILDSLKRMTLVAPDKTFGVKLYFMDGVLRIEANNPEIGQGIEEIPMTYTGKELAIGFNAKYLIELLGQIEHPEICLELNGELDPVLLRPSREKGSENRYLGVVMPMRI